MKKLEICIVFEITRKLCRTREAVIVSLIALIILAALCLCAHEVKKKAKQKTV